MSHIFRNKPTYRILPESRSPFPFAGPVCFSNGEDEFCILETGKRLSMLTSVGSSSLSSSYGKLPKGPPKTEDRRTSIGFKISTPLALLTYHNPSSVATNSSSHFRSRVVQLPTGNTRNEAERRHITSPHSVNSKGHSTAK